MGDLVQLLRKEPADALVIEEPVEEENSLGGVVAVGGIVTAAVLALSSSLRVVLHTISHDLSKDSPKLIPARVLRVADLIFFDAYSLETSLYILYVPQCFW